MRITMAEARQIALSALARAERERGEAAEREEALWECADCASKDQHIAALEVDLRAVVLALTHLVPHGYWADCHADRCGDVLVECEAALARPGVNAVLT